MAEKKGTFTSENQPKNRRGKTFKTKVLEVIKEESLLDLSSNASREKTERAYLKLFVSRALDKEDPASPALMRELISRSYAGLKPTMPSVEFEFNEDSNPAEQVSQIIKAVSKGELPPDVAVTLVQAQKIAIDIEEATELKERIEELEKLLNAQSS